MSERIAGSLFAALPPPGPDEDVATLLSRPGLRIERIVSLGQASPPGFWYDQHGEEWVLVVQGAALLRFADEPAPRRLNAGDFLLIPARARHRVEWTDPDNRTIWLALHID